MTHFLLECSRNDLKCLKIFNKKIIESPITLLTLLDYFDWGCICVHIVLHLKKKKKDLKKKQLILGGHGYFFHLKKKKKDKKETFVGLLLIGHDYFFHLKKTKKRGKIFGQTFVGRSWFSLFDGFFNWRQQLTGCSWNPPFLTFPFFFPFGKFVLVPFCQ